MAASELDRRISDCGKALAVAAIPAYTVDGKVHPPTLVCACARMAGYYLLRSAGAVTAAMTPGAPILSPQVAERSGVLARTCAAVLASLGHALPPDPPRPLIAADAMPREELLESEARLRPLFTPLQNRFSLDDYPMARAGAVAAALVAHTVRKVLKPERSFGLAVYGFAEGSQSVPHA
jgi:hypothetical protein